MCDARFYEGNAHVHARPDTSNHDATSFFTSLLEGGAPPGTSFEPLIDTPFEVVAVGSPQAREEFFSVSAPIDENDGTFRLSFREGLPIDVIAIRLLLNSTQIYRSAFSGVSAMGQALNIYLLQPRIPTTSGVTAGQVSANLHGQGLPGNSQLIADFNGVSVAGHKEGVKLAFTVQVVPDVMFDLDVFLDLNLTAYNIHVGWPADLCVKAKSILKKIRKSLRDSGTAVNDTVVGNIELALTGSPNNLPQAAVQALLDLVSIQFTSVLVPGAHSWPLSDVTDETIVLVPQPGFGFPRRWSE